MENKVFFKKLKNIIISVKTKEKDLGDIQFIENLNQYIYVPYEFVYLNTSHLEQITKKLKELNRY